MTAKRPPEPAPTHSSHLDVRAPKLSRINSSRQKRETARSQPARCASASLVSKPAHVRVDAEKELPAWLAALARKRWAKARGHSLSTSRRARNSAGGSCIKYRLVSSLCAPALCVPKLASFMGLWGPATAPRRHARCFTFGRLDSENEIKSCQKVGNAPSRTNRLARQEIQRMMKMQNILLSKTMPSLSLKKKKLLFDDAS